VSYIRVRVRFFPGCGPRNTRDPVCDGRKLLQIFHRFPTSNVIWAPCRRTIPRVLVRLGELRGLIYSSDRGRRTCPRTYIHFMETPPQLVCDPEGRQLYIVGGHYRITPRGIEG
jgi:hypothetical protein